MGELGLTAAPLPESVGGAGFSYLGWTLVMEELGAADMATAVTLSVHILSQYPVVTFGTAEQHAGWLAPMLTGEALGAFCLTEPHAGSDAAALRTRAVRLGAGGEELAPDAPADAVAAYRLNGTKIWISNAPEAERYLVFATVDPSKGPKGITAFLVEKGTPGFRVRRPRDGRWGSEPVRRRSSSSTGPWSRRPAASAPRARATGSRCRRSLRAGSRSPPPASGSPGRRSSRRRPTCTSATAFGAPLAELQGLRFMLAEMAREVAAARALTHEAARAKDRGEPIGELSSLAKWTASDAAMKVATDAVQLFGGSGYSRETGHRAPDARRQGRPDLRGHQPDPPPHRRGRGAQARESLRARWPAGPPVSPIGLTG